MCVHNVTEFDETIHCGNGTRVESGGDNHTCVANVTCNAAGDYCGVGTILANAMCVHNVTAVYYTHLTLPTTLRVYVSVVDT